MNQLDMVFEDEPDTKRNPPPSKPPVVDLGPSIPPEVSAINKKFDLIKDSINLALDGFKEEILTLVDSHKHDVNNKLQVIESRLTRIEKEYTTQVI